MGFVSGPTVHVQWMFSLMQCPVRVIGVRSGPMLSEARNEVAERFLKDFTEDYLVTTDTDIVFTRQDVDYLLSHDAPLASGLYAAETGQLMAGRWYGETGMMETLEESPSEVTLVDSVGAGFLAVRRDALEKIGPGWFNYMSVDGREIGEDVAFCRRASAAGYQIVLDPRIRLAHLKVMEVRPDTLLYQYRFSSESDGASESASQAMPEA